MFSTPHLYNQHQHHHPSITHPRNIPPPSQALPSITMGAILHPHHMLVSADYIRCLIKSFNITGHRLPMANWTTIWVPQPVYSDRGIGTSCAFAILITLQWTSNRCPDKNSSQQHCWLQWVQCQLSGILSILAVVLTQWLGLLTQFDTQHHSSCIYYVPIKVSSHTSHATSDNYWTIVLVS